MAIQKFTLVINGNLGNMSKNDHIARALESTARALESTSEAADHGVVKDSDGTYVGHWTKDYDPRGGSRKGRY